MEDTHSPLKLSLIMIAAPTACHNATHNCNCTTLSLQHSSHMRGVEIHPERYDSLLRFVVRSDSQTYSIPTYLPACSTTYEYLLTYLSNQVTTYTNTYLQ